MSQRRLLPSLPRSTGERAGYRRICSSSRAKRVGESSYGIDARPIDRSSGIADVCGPAGRSLSSRRRHIFRGVAPVRPMDRATADYMGMLATL